MDPLTSRSPSIAKATLIYLSHRLTGKQPPFRFDWKETLLDTLVRFIIGLILGGGFAFILVPVIFWPKRRNRPSVWDALGHPGWIGWFFLAIWLGTALLMALRTKARIHHLDPDRTDPPLLLS